MRFLRTSKQLRNEIKQLSNETKQLRNEIYLKKKYHLRQIERQPGTDPGFLEELSPSILSPWQLISSYLSPNYLGFSQHNKF